MHSQHLQVDRRKATKLFNRCIQNDDVSIESNKTTKNLKGNCTLLMKHKIGCILKIIIV